MPHEPGHLLQDDPIRQAPNRLSLAGAVVRDGNAFRQTGGPVTLASAQQSLGINPQLSSLSTIGNSAEELQNRQGTLDQINAATNRLRVQRLGRIANRPGIAGDAARNELQNIGVQPSIARASQINNLADTLAQQRQREQLVQSNLGAERARRSAQDLLLSRIQRAGLSDVEEDVRAGALAAELLPQFTQDAPELGIPALQTQGLASADLLQAQQAELDRQTQRDIAEGRNIAGLAAAELDAASRLGVADLQNQGIAQQAALTSAREEAKLATQERFDAEKARQGASNTFAILDKLDDLSEFAGPTANAVAVAGGTPILGSLGAGSETAARRAEFNALTNQLVLAAAQQLPGVLSDTDIQLLKEQGPQFGVGTQANRAIIENFRDLLERRLADRGVDITNIAARIERAQQSDPDVTVENVRETAQALGISESAVLRRLGF